VICVDRLLHPPAPTSEIRQPSICGILPSTAARRHQLGHHLRDDDRGIFSEWVAPYDPLAVDFASLLTAPSWDHWCGTDAYGRDICSR